MGRVQGNGAVRQNVSGKAWLLSDLCSFFRRFFDRFWGKKVAELSGALPPTAAQTRNTNPATLAG